MTHTHDGASVYYPEYFSHRGWHFVTVEGDIEAAILRVAMPPPRLRKPDEGRGEMWCWFYGATPTETSSPAVVRATAKTCVHPWVRAWSGKCEGCRLVQISTGKLDPPPDDPDPA
jgi:hypothetical protein